MRQFQLEIPTKIYYGRNVTEDALKQQMNWLCGNIMIVTTGGALISNGYVGELEQMIHSMKYVKKVIVNCEISRNPKLQEIKKIIQQGIEQDINVLVGFGGGSSIDAAKAIAAGIGNKEHIEEYFDKGIEPSQNTLPIIAIPTTAGTGSELSKAAILTDYVKKIKGGIRGTNLYPKVAIVDSKYTDTVPYKISMETGFDVVAHAIESYISKKATLFTEMLSEKVIEIVGANLSKLSSELQNQEARDQMSYASMLMGINLGNASTCLPHRMQYPIGAHTDTSHGIGLASIFPAWIFYEYTYSEEKIKKVIYLLTKKRIENREDAVQEIKNFLVSIGLDMSLRRLGIQNEELGKLESEVTGSIENDPAAVEKQIIGKIYQMAF